MYEAFYRLSADPFRLTPDPGFSFRHRSYRKAMTYMLHALQRAEGCIMITGQPGTGKTTLVNDLIRTLRPNQSVVAKIVSTQLTAGELLNLVAYSFNLDVHGFDKARVLVEMQRFLKRHHEQGRRPLLIVDEAQDMGEDALEELRLLMNILEGNHQLLQVFLVGQVQLRDTVNTPALEQLNQRLIATALLEPLDSDETEAYLKHRLRRANWRGDPLISKQAYAMIQRYGDGIPRRMNQICSRLFLHGCIEEKHRLGLADVRLVVEELEQELLLPTAIMLIDEIIPGTGNNQAETYEEEPQPAPPAWKAPVPIVNPLAASKIVERPSPSGLASTKARRAARAHSVASGSQTRRYRKRQTWLLRSLALVATLHHYASRTAHLLRDGVAKLDLSAMRRSALTLLSRLKPLLAAVKERLSRIRHQAQWKGLAVLAVVCRYVAAVKAVLPDGLEKKFTAPMTWGRTASVLVAISILAAIYFRAGDGQPVSGPQTLALSRDATEPPLELKSGDAQGGSIQSSPAVVATGLASDQDASAAIVSVSRPAGFQKTSVAAPLSIDQTAARELATMETVPSQSAAPIVETDTAITVATKPDVDAEQHKPRGAVRERAAEASVVAAAPRDSQPDTVVASATTKKEVKVAVSPSQEAKIAVLLEHGWRALRHDRLMIPKNNNAYHYFQRVRKLDPQNSDARSGIDQIVARYIRLTREAMEDNELKKAKQYIARGLSIRPGNTQLLALREQISAPSVTLVADRPSDAIEPASPESRQHGGLFMRVKGFFSGQSTDEIESATR